MPISQSGQQPLTIKSIQRGTIALGPATSNTATITSVNTSYAQLANLGQQNGNPTVAGAQQSNVRLAFTNATTITGTTTGDDGSAITVGFQVTETAQ